MSERVGETAVPTTGHLLTVTKGPDWFEEDGEVVEIDWQGEVICLAPGGCGGWWECDGTHQMAGQDADSGPYEADVGAPWQDQEEFTFHGVLHTWQSMASGWTVPYEGCVVQTVDTICDDAYEIGQKHGEGTYVVDAEWEDLGECRLLFGYRTPLEPPTPDRVARVAEGGGL